VSTSVSSINNSQQLAREFLAAYKAGKPIALPPSARDAAFDMGVAYAVEAEFRRLREAEGHRFVGRKVGYANKAAWRVLKLETLVWASMYDDTVHMGVSEISLSNCVSPKLEPEIVFKLKDAGTIEWMALGFEIIDCPFPNWEFKPLDFVAAWGLHKALVIGEPSWEAAAPDQLASFKLKLYKNGEFVEEGSGRNSLRSPALCLAELASRTALSPGELISTGTLTNGQPIAPGELWRAEVEGLPLPPLVLSSLGGGNN
jgi:2-oxo-3-hexenedioate decarboxylase